MSSYKSMFKIIKFIVSIIAIVMVVLIVIQRFSNNKISIGGIRIFTVVTESMEPIYNVGDVLLVKYEDPKKPTAYMVGDDIAYQGEVDDYAGKVITHRLQKIEEKQGERTYITKGISPKVENEDPPITGDQIYGKVLKKLYIMSFLSSIINNNYGMYFLVVIPLAFIIFTEFKGYKKDKEEMLKEDSEEEEYYDDRDYDRRRYDYDEKDYNDRDYEDRRYNRRRYDSYEDEDYDDKKYNKRRYDVYQERNYDNRRYDSYEDYDDREYDDRRYNEKRYDDYEDIDCNERRGKRNYNRKYDDYDN